MKHIISFLNEKRRSLWLHIKNSEGLNCQGGNLQQTRFCSNGTSSGSYTYSASNNRNCNCYVDGKNTLAATNFRKGWYLSGSTVNFLINTTAQCTLGVGTTVTYRCDDGLWYDYLFNWSTNTGIENGNYPAARTTGNTYSCIPTSVVNATKR